MRTATLCISFFLGFHTGNSEYVGIPQMTWIDASKLCSLQTFAEVEKDLKIDLTAIQKRNITKVWTGTRVAYSHWSAFIGCVAHITSATSVNIGTAKDSVKKCLLECSFKENQTHFVIKDTDCICLSTEPQALGKHNRCRKKCTDSEKGYCNSGKGYMVFKLLKDIESTKTNKFPAGECLFSVHQDGRNIDRNEDCKLKNSFDCKSAKGLVFYGKLNWNSYQNKCLNESTAVLFPSNESILASKSQWKPVFRTHMLLSDGELVSEGSCIALNVDLSNKTTYSLENCTESYQFLCLESGRQACTEKPYDYIYYSRFIEVPVTALIAGAFIICVLLTIIFAVVLKLLKTIKFLKKLRHQGSGRRMNLVSYTGLQSRADESGYIGLDGTNAGAEYEVPDNLDAEDLSTDVLDRMGYIRPEQHYHTISESPT